MKNNLEIAAYLALIVLFVLMNEAELSAEEIFGIIEEYLKEQGV